MAITRSHVPSKRSGTAVTPKKSFSRTLLNRVHDRSSAAISKVLPGRQNAKRDRAAPSAQLQAELESAVSRIASVKEPQKAPQFLFVPFPDVEDIAEDAHLAIDASNTSDCFLARYPMYNAQNMAMIQQELGKGFASYGMTSTKPYYEIPILHQGVVTMQHLSHTFNRDVTFRSWKWLQAQLKMANARPKRAPAGKVGYQPSRKPASHPRKSQQHAIFTDPKAPCIFYIHWTTDPGPPAADVEAIYNTIRTLQSSRPDHLIRAFPSLSELNHDSMKIPDIQALDHIAATSPPAYAYRPHTCFTHASPSHNQTTCPLRKHSEIIMKRTHSSAGQHVQLVPGSRAWPHHLSSSPSSHDNSPMSPSSSSPIWFAQSNEPFFTDFGEFRVLIIADRSKAQKGQQGRIISTIITEWVDPDGDPTAMYARVATPYDFLNSQHLSPLTLPDLHAFALHVYGRLLEREDRKTAYESLEVGVRLDIGVGVQKGKGKGKGKGEKRFFVNEITRFYGADFFSQHTLGAPQQEVCLGFAEAMDKYFGVEKVKAEDE